VKHYLHWILVIAFFATLWTLPAYSQGISIEDIAREIDSETENQLGTESEKARTLFQSPTDPEGKLAFGELKSYIQTYRDLRASNRSQVNALSAVYREKNNFYETGGKTPRAQAFKLFCKSTFPTFMAAKPGTYQLEDAILPFGSMAFVSQLGAKNENYFKDEIMAARRYLLANAENSTDFLKYLKKSGGDWQDMLPKERLARLQAVAGQMLMARDKFKNPNDFYEGLKQVEHWSANPADRFDYQDILMKMVELTGADLQTNPANPAARAQLEFLNRVATGARPQTLTTSDSRLGEMVDEIFESERQASPDDQIHRDNDVRKMKAAMILEKLARLAGSDTVRQELVGHLNESLPSQRRPAELQGCVKAYQDLSMKGFYSISLPKKP
jgi:hypothetical protein